MNLKEINKMKFKKIYIEITNQCNLSCSFCSKDHLPAKEMTLHEFKHVLKEINPYTDYLYLHVKGEPLMHTQFDEILFLCKKYNKKVNLTTNGFFLAKQLDAIVNTGVVRQINLSLHATYPKENQVLNQILKSTDILLQKTDIEIVYRFWALPSKGFSDSQAYKIDQICTFFNLSDEKKVEIEEKQNIILRKHLYLNKESEFEWPSLEKDKSISCGTCYGTRKHLAILAGGNVVPCCLDSAGVITFGNIYKETFDTIIKKDRFQKMKSNFQNHKVLEPLCQKCTYRLKFK
ncbi:MAG: radical SAM protein [Bacilli bacterium]|nr:radical SAM protein [Bacilli bacterium]